MSKTNFISDDDLNAYIDGALGEERALLVRNALAEDPELAERAAQFQADKALFRAVYGPLADRPVPAEWIARAQQRSRVNWRLAGAIAAVLLVAALGPLAWHFYVPAPGRDVVEMALDARQGMAAGESGAAGNDNVRSESFDAAFRQTVASNVHIPDLSRMGYKFRGLNLYGKAAEIVYRGPQDQLFTLYVRRSDGSARFDQFERRGLRVCIWQDDQISTVMAGNISAAVMQRLATLSYTGLTS